MATISYDVSKPLSLLAAQSVSNLTQALEALKRVSGLALATASAAGNAAQDATWAVVEGSSSEYGIVSSGSAGVNGHAWFTAVDTLATLLDNSAVLDALHKLDNGA